MVYLANGAGKLAEHSFGIDGPGGGLMHVETSFIVIF